MQEMQAGVWYWTAPHREWTPPSEWAMGDVATPKHEGVPDRGF